MKVISLSKNLLFLPVIFLCVISSPVLAMDSDNYSVPSSTSNSGGTYSTSDNYRLWQNTGEAANGEMESRSKKIFSGFLVPDEPHIEFLISKGIVHLGVLSSTSVASDGATLTVTTNVSGGYSVVANDSTEPGQANGLIDGDKKIPDATTAPNDFQFLLLAGNPHFGLVVTGTNADGGYAAGTKMNSLNDQDWALVGAYSNIVDSDNLNVSFRASVSASTAASDHYQTASTFICTVNF